MAYDDDLAERIRGCLGSVEAVEKKMFGGLAFLVGGHMAVAASGPGGLMVRCPPDDHDELVVAPHAGPMEMKGRSLRGWVLVADAGSADDADLERWVRIGTSYAGSLPPK